MRQESPHLRINNLEVGQNKQPKWAEYSCQTQAVLLSKVSSPPILFRIRGNRRLNF